MVISRRGVSIACVALLIVAAALGSPVAQADLRKVLVGKWEGDVQVLDRSDPKRTLVIDSVDASAKSAQGRWGITGQGLGQVRITIGDDAGKVSLKFTTGTNTSVRLDLVGDKDLAGTFTPQGTQQSLRDLTVRLKKID